MILAWSLVIGAASYRLWRLIAEDDITESVRGRILSSAPEWISELVYCSWCLGSYCAFGVTWATDATVGLDAPVLVGLAAAVVVGWLGENL